MSSADLSAAVAVIDATDAERGAVVLAAAKLKEVLAAGAPTADVIASSRNICRALSRVATSDALHEGEWDSCADAVVQGLVARPEVPWVQRAFAAKTLVSSFLPPTTSWGAKEIELRSGKIFRVLFDALRQAAEPAEQRIYRDQLLAVAQRFAEGAAAAVVDMTAPSAPGEPNQCEAPLAQVLESANSPSYGTFLAAVHRKLPPDSSLAARIPAYEGKAGLDASRRLSRLADSSPVTVENSEAWVDDLEAAAQLAVASRARCDVATVAAILTRAAQVLQEQSSETGRLRLSRAVVSFVISQHDKEPLDNKEAFDAGVAFVQEVLKTSRFAAIGGGDLDVADAQMPLTETGLLLAKLLSKSKCYPTSSSETSTASEEVAEPSFGSMLKTVCERALPAVRDARKAVQAYLSYHRETVGMKRQRATAEVSGQHASILSANVCLLVVAALMGYFALGQDTKVTPSWTGGK